MTYAHDCAGIHAPGLAWPDWNCTWVTEIEPFPCALLKHRYPTVPNLGDMTKVHANEHGAIDLLFGGTPCQGFSVAGRRKGLDDDRSALAWHFLRHAREARPRWLVWENVPGARQGDLAEDLHAFISEVRELGYLGSYATLDAQYFGVPQSRDRIFLVAYLGDWRPATAVLFDPDCLRGNSQARRKAETRVAALTANGIGTCGADDNQAQAGHLITSNDVSFALNAGGMGRQDFETELLIANTLRSASNSPRAHGKQNGTDRETLIAHTTGAGFWKEGAGTLRAREQESHEHLIVNTLRGEGHDASEDGTGRGIPIITNTLCSDGKRQNDGIPYVFDCVGTKVHTKENGITPALRSMTADKSHDNRSSHLAIAFAQNQAGSVLHSEQMHALGTNSNSTGRNSPTAMIGSTVRRLTPRECERLMGFPDDYTLVPFRGKPASDSVRYKACGNSIAVPPLAWLGRRINLAESILSS